MISIVITVILISTILSSITYNSNVSFELKRINNLYADIRTLEDKIAIYYLNNGTLPVIKSEATGLPKEVYLDDISVNPNDNDIFYEIDTSLLSNLSLNHMLSTDKFYINSQSHMIYFGNGINVEGETIYTVPLEYVDLEEFYLQFN